jgi:tetratricopeptide (TPR) repeat protein
MKITKLKSIKIIWAAPVILGLLAGFIITKPRQSQSSQMISPVASKEKTVKSISSDGGRMDSSEVIQGSNSNQPLDTYLLTAQSLLTKAIALSKETNADNNQRIVELINQAIDTTNEAIANFPSSASAYAQQAKTYQTISEYMPEAFDAAVAYYQQAIKIDANNPTYYDSLADLYLTQINADKIAEGETSGKENLRGSAGSSEVGELTDGVGIGHLDLALFYLDKAVEADPTNPNRIKKLAEIQSQAGYINQSKITYQRLLGIISDDNQIAKIENEINSLNKLLAEAAAQGKTSEATRRGSSQVEELGEIEELADDGTDITLPDSPPKLQAHHLAGTQTYIAEPKDSSDGGRMDSSEVSKSNAKSGSAVIPAGKREIEICNNNLGPDTQVYLTPEGETKNIILFVKSKSAYDPASDHCPNFTAGIARPLEQDLKFKWWIIAESDK